jgi:hypothetical protein
LQFLRRIAGKSGSEEAEERRRGGGAEIAFAAPNLKKRVQYFEQFFHFFRFFYAF